MGKCGYFLDFVYSHEKTNRNLIDKFKCIIQWNTKIQIKIKFFCYLHYRQKNSLKKIKGEIITKKQRTNSDIYLLKLKVCVRVNSHCVIYRGRKPADQSEAFKSSKLRLG